MTDITANDGVWTFLCVSWTSQEGIWAIYKDGLKVDEGSGLAAGQKVEANGTLILGQEQDSPGGGFSAAESFRGKMHGFNMWNNVAVTQQQVTALMTSCKHTLKLSQSDSEFDNILISWSDFSKNESINGFIRLEPVGLCQGCVPLSPPSHGYVRFLGGNNINNRGWDAHFSSNNWSLRQRRQERQAAARIVQQHPRRLQRVMRKRQWPRSSNNAKAIFSCEEGYVLTQGTSVRTCGILGQWRGKQPICKLIDCGYPEYLEHGFVTHSDTLYGSEASYWCKRGYQVANGDSSRRCNRDGSWSGTKPTCKAVTCNVSPEDFQDGRIMNSKSSGYYDIGDRLNLVCDSGFILDGPDSLNCLEDGSWSDILPTCIPKPCLEFPKVKNGFAIEAESSLYDDVIGSNVAITNVSLIVCKKGFSLERSRSDKLVCHNSRWTELNTGDDSTAPSSSIASTSSTDSAEGGTTTLLGSSRLMDGSSSSVNSQGQLPTCQLINCGHPPLMAHSKLLSVPSSYSFNSRAIVTCLQDYEFMVLASHQDFLQNYSQKQKVRQKRLVISCSTDGIWKALSVTTKHQTGYGGNKKGGRFKTLGSIPLSMLQCRPKECNPPPYITDGMVEFSGLRVGSMARYSCEKGFILKGRGQRRCLPTARWSHSQPYCQSLG